MAMMKVTEFAELARKDPEGALAQLDGAEELRQGALQRVRSYEQRYSMSSEQMRERLAANRIRETAEICSWLFDLRILERTAYLDQQ